MRKYKSESDFGHKCYEDFKLASNGVLDCYEGQIEDTVWKRIENTTHNDTRKVFTEHRANYELVKCIECMEQCCGVNGDDSFTYVSMQYLDLTTNLFNLKQG